MRKKTKMNSAELKNILDQLDDDEEYPVRVYTSYNMYEVVRVMVNKGRLLIFTGDANNLEPLDDNVHYLSANEDE
jgi:hypothetical protein